MTGMKNLNMQFYINMLPPDETVGFLKRNVVNISIFGDVVSIAWRRDALQWHAFHVEFYENFHINSSNTGIDM
jgi:hypothetical protein